MTKFLLRVGRRGLWLVAGACLAGALIGGASGASTGTVRAVSNAALGTKIIVSPGGFTLYHLISEKKGSITCTATCSKSWLPLLVVGKAKPVAGAGLIASKLGTIKRPGGGVQVTYSGFALYRYSADKKAGQVLGQGVKRAWYAVTPAGSVTKLSASAVGLKTTPSVSTTPASTTPSSTTTPSTTMPSSTTPSSTTTTGTDCTSNPGGDGCM